METGFNATWAFFMLLLVIAAVPVVIWTMRRLPAWRTTGRGTLEIQESLSLGPREKIMVLRSGDKHLLIGATAQSIQLLTELPDYEQHSDNGKPVQADLAKSFAAQLRDANNGR